MFLRRDYLWLPSATPSFSTPLSLVALLSTFGVYRVLEKTKANACVVTGRFVVAQKELAEGTAIDQMGVVVAQWPVYTIPAGAFTSIDSVAGRVTRVTVYKGEVLVPGRLAPDGTGPGLAVKIAQGKRAVAFRINDVSGIAGLYPARQPRRHLGRHGRRGGEGAHGQGVPGEHAHLGHWVGPGAERGRATHQRHGCHRGGHSE